MLGDIDNKSADERGVDQHHFFHGISTSLIPQPFNDSVTAFQAAKPFIVYKKNAGSDTPSGTTTFGKRKPYPPDMERAMTANTTEKSLAIPKKCLSGSLVLVIDIKRNGEQKD
ncbi:hypothetical protein D3C71_1729500 [compost metagenome]